MKTISIDTLISLGSLLLASATTFAGVLLWYINSEKKKYAAERDFNHIRRNQEQMQTSLNHLFEEIDRQLKSLERDVLEIRTILDLKRYHD